MNPHIPAFLKAKRIERKLSVTNTAQLLGISREHLSRIESGKYSMTLDKYLLLCNILKIRPCEPLEGICTS